MAAREKKISNASIQAREDSRRNDFSSENRTLEKQTAETQSKAPLETAEASEASKADASSHLRANVKKSRSAAPAGDKIQRSDAGIELDNAAGNVRTFASETGMDESKTAVELAGSERRSNDIETKRVEMIPVSTPGKFGNNPDGLGGAMATASAVVVKSGTDTEATRKAPAFVSPHKLAAPKAAPASAKADRDEQNGDQKAMKTSTNRHGFKLSEFVVYPAHGVGQIVSMEEQEVAGFKLELFVINFVKDKMTLRVPTSKVAAVGMRKLSDLDAARRSLEILTGRARVKRTMWSRRAQEYEAKINSGDINAIAEVVRDLFRSDAQPEQSYSERQLYEAALDRMMREIAAVHKLTESEALKMIEGQLKKNVKRAPKPETAGGEAEAETEDADIEEAA